MSRCLYCSVAWSAHQRALEAKFARSRTFVVRHMEGERQGCEQEQPWISSIPNGSRGLQERVRQFARRHVEPVEKLYYEQVKPEGRGYKTPRVL